MEKFPVFFFLSFFLSFSLSFYFFSHSFFLSFFLSLSLPPFLYSTSFFSVCLFVWLVVACALMRIEPNLVFMTSTALSWELQTRARLTQFTKYKYYPTEYWTSRNAPYKKQHPFTDCCCCCYCCCCWWWVQSSLQHTCIYAYIYRFVYVYMCVCVSVYVCVRARK